MEQEDYIMNKINAFITLMLVFCALGGVSVAVVSAKKYADIRTELTRQTELKEPYKDDCLRLMNKLSEVRRND